MSEEKFLKGKVALITGAGSGGFGRKMALAFASKGAKLVINDINEEGLKQTQEIIQKEYNVEILVVKADISDSKQVQEMAIKVFEKFDNLFLLVNNAGIDGGLYPTLKQKEVMYDKIMAINLKGAWNVTKAFYKQMRRQKHFTPIAGKIINIASCAGTANGANPQVGIYSVSKAGLLAFTRLWALELGKNNITVNAISPGVFLTPIYNNDPKLIRDFLKTRGVKIPIDKIGETKWVADVALFLASPGADYITGQNIIIDGGMTISVNKL
ncbi:MAG: SDR family NAD(P)-dependent oxidoreductase [Candidatus Thorarchaeota archaeon]